MTPPALELSNVHFAYGATPVLHGVSLSVSKGAFCAVLGANGAGKSTVFHLLCGLLVPQSGQVRINGVDLTQQNPAQRREIGAVFQHTSLDAELSVWQNLIYAARLYGVPDARARIMALSAQFDLGDVLHKRVRALSGGFKRRCEIVRALVHDPSILILDEPTAGLDAPSKEAITNALHQLADGGLTVLWITHLLDELRDEDHVIVMERGAIRDTGQFAALGGASVLAKTYATAQRAAL